MIADTASTTDSHQPRPEAARLTEADVTEQLRGRPHAFVDVGHAKLAYWKLGRGPDVVCVHGWPLHAATFRRVAPVLARDFTLHLFDLPGAGQTEWTDASKISMADHVATLRAFVDALGLSRFAYLAHDSGGAFARMAAADDRRVSALVLGNTEIPGHTPWLVELYAAVARVPGLRSAFLASMASRAVRPSFLAFGGCFADPTYADGEFFELFVKPLVVSKRAGRGQLQLAATLDVSVFDDLATIHRRIDAPVRLLWGPRDPFFPIEKARAMLTQLPRADLVEIPGAKLFAHEDFAEPFAAHAREHLLAHA